MKRINLKPFLALLFILTVMASRAQEEKPELTLAISYVSTEKGIPYLKLQTQVRKEKTIEAVSGVPVSVYLNEESEAGFIGRAVTNEKGLGRVVLPPSAKEAWMGSPKHTIIAKTDESKLYAAGSTEIEVAKARIQIDTLVEEGVRNITASFQEFDGTDWVPASEVELKIGVQRQGGILPISDEESYTTDSTGMVTDEFKRNSLPGDKQGNLVIVVRTEDHEMFGNMRTEKVLPWGVVINTKNEQFGKRSLWATGDKVPLWLLFIALSVIVGVWSVIVFLVVMIVRLKKLGRAQQEPRQPVTILTRQNGPEAKEEESARESRLQ